MSALIKLIEQDYTIKGRGRWLTTEEHDSLVIDVDKDIFFWNSKHIAGDAIQWLIKVKGYTKAEALNILSKYDSEDTIAFTVISDMSTRKQVTVYPKLVDLLWENGKRYREYWYNRGITDQTIDQFMLGYHQGWYTIPFFVDSTFMNFQMRRDIPEKRMLNWYKGIGHILFNSSVLRVCNTVIITESPTDAILLNQSGYPNVISHNGGAGSWASRFYKYFINQKEIFVVYDNDTAGRKGAIKVANALGINRTKVYTFDGFKPGYDLGNWIKENNAKDFGELLLERSRHIFE